MTTVFVNKSVNSKSLLLFVFLFQITLNSILYFFINNSVANAQDNKPNCASFEDCVAKWEKNLINDKFDEDIFLLKKALDLWNPSYGLDKKEKVEQGLVSVYLGHGKTFEEMGEYEKAIQDYTTVIKSKPEHVFAYQLRAYAYMNIEKYEEAISDYTRAIELVPDVVDAALIDYTGRGKAYYSLGKNDKALLDFTKAIELIPDDPILYDNRGSFYHNTGQYNDAIKDFTKAIKLDSEIAEAYYNRGLSYEAIQDCEKANKDFKKACSLGVDESCSAICK